MSAVHLTQENFENEVAQSSVPVLVDFWAEWCGPCRMISPIIEQISEEYAGKLKVAKVNVDDNQELAMRFNVMSIPTLIVFKKGNPVDQIIGAVSKDHLAGRLKQHL